MSKQSGNKNKESIFSKIGNAISDAITATKHYTTKWLFTRPLLGKRVADGQQAMYDKMLEARKQIRKEKEAGTYAIESVKQPNIFQRIANLFSKDKNKEHADGTNLNHPDMNLVQPSARGTARNFDANSLNGQTTEWQDKFKKSEQQQVSQQQAVQQQDSHGIRGVERKSLKPEELGKRTDAERAQQNSIQ